MTPRRILFAAGGTGGHIFPARAAAEAMVARGWETRLVTDARGLKHTAGFPAVAVDQIHAASPSTKNPVKLARAALELGRGFGETRAIVKAWRPDFVAGFGGYPAFPALAVARTTGLPFAIHEQNAVLGRVNRVFARQAAFIASGFDRLDGYGGGAADRRIVTGNPLRRPILDARAQAYEAPAPDGRIRLLVLGGSLGARLLSETVPQAVALLPEALRARLDVAQQTREESLSMATDVYRQAGVAAECSPFFSDVGERYAGAHLLIARAGASSVSEIAGIGRPAIFCPLAIAADDHQTANAKGLADALAADLLPEADFTAERLAELIEQRLKHPTELSERAAAARTLGRPDAAESFARAVEGVMQGALV